MLEPSTHPVVANGIIAGQYHAPIAEFIFPEQVVGSPVPPINLESIPFLACGGYILTAGTITGPLNPWPSVPATICGGPVVTPPTAVVGATQTVASGPNTTVSLNAGASTGTAPLAFLFTRTGFGGLPPVVLQNATTSVARFTAPTVAVSTTLTFQVTVTNSAGTSSAPVTVTVDPAGAPLVSHIAPLTVASGTPVSITANAGGGAGGPFTFTFTQTGGSLVILPVPSSINPLAFVPVLPPGTAAPITLQFNVVAKDKNLVASAPEFFTVTVNPQPDTITITVVEYRTSKDRLTVAATSSVISQALVLTLQPYISINAGAPRTRAA